MQVKNVFANSQPPQVGELSSTILRHKNVRIERISGKLTDHYDPENGVLRLSSEVYGSDSVAALGVAAHCDACLGFHAKALVHLGATLAEVEEALAMAVYMGGGPSLMYSANALAAFKEFSAAKAG